jgi:hypothetical protein
MSNTIDDAGDSRPRTRSLDKFAAGAGAAGGAGVSTALFATLGVGKILLGPIATTPSYPLAILGMVSLFCLIAAMFIIPVSQANRPFVFIGITAFLVISCICALPILYDDMARPPATLHEFFSPSLSDIRSDDSNGPINLQLMYSSSASLKSGEEVTFQNGDQHVRSGDAIYWNLKGLSDLSNKYNGLYTLNRERSTMLKEVCLNSSDPICQMVNLQMAGYAK